MATALRKKAGKRGLDAQIAEIMCRHYTRALVQNNDGTWFAEVEEFSGCMTEGDTPEEAIENLDDAMAGWIRIHLQDGDQIPQPRLEQEFSGKFLIRMAKSLHRELKHRADHEDVSLNQYVVTVLARSAGET